MSRITLIITECYSYHFFTTQLKAGGFSRDRMHGCVNKDLQLLYLRLFCASHSPFTSNPLLPQLLQLFELRRCKDEVCVGCYFGLHCNAVHKYLDARYMIEVLSFEDELPVTLYRPFH